ncbi:unnamed protein product [Nippostrongylus brasiliensis]|uniref:Uncharacterized protein n=1 Tax=Nippostrongylus brasiliensis TaxID=27835 RepID=A0A0N4YNT4_NIPBR|nr:unnamed protein product [Nippostrongylus brasiliensis]
MKFAPKTAPIALPKGSGEKASKSGSGESGSRKRRVPKMSRGSGEKIKKAKAGRRKRARKGKDDSPGKDSADDLGKKSGESVSKASGEAISASKRKRQRGMYRSGSESVDVSEHSDEDAEPESDSIEVLIPDELNEYVEKITVGKLSRYGFARSLRLRKMVLYLVALSYMGSLTSFTMFNYSIHRQGCE